MSSHPFIAMDGTDQLRNPCWQPIPWWTNFGEIPALLSDAVAGKIVEFCSSRALLTISLLGHERWTVPIERALGRVFHNHFPTLLIDVDDLWHAHGVRPGTERRPRTFSLTKYFEGLMRLTSWVILRQSRVDADILIHMRRAQRQRDPTTPLSEIYTRPPPWTYPRAASMLADKCVRAVLVHSPPQSCWFIHVCCMCEQPFRCSITPTNQYNQYDYGACTCRMRDYALWPICEDGEQTSTREQCAHPVCSKECQRARRRPVFY